MSRKAYIRRLIVRAIEDSLVLTGMFVGVWLVGSGVSLLFGL
jgi:hypothetical protein